MKFASELQNRSDQFAQVIKACRYILETDPIAAEARKYLDNRLSKNTQKTFDFGYFPNDDNLDYLTSLVDKSILEELTLIYPRYVSGGTKLRGHLHHHNLIMPFRDVHGRIVSLLGRTLLSSEKQSEYGLQKYKYTIGANKDLYVFGLDKAVNSIVDKNCVICVEGQFDCIACHAEGITNVVAFGWANCTRYQFFQLHRYTNNLVLLLDNDDAGTRARLKLKERYGAYANIVALTPPKDFKDIDDFLRDSNDQTRKQSTISNLKNIHTVLGV